MIIPEKCSTAFELAAVMKVRESEIGETVERAFCRPPKERVNSGHFIQDVGVGDGDLIREKWSEVVARQPEPQYVHYWGRGKSNTYAAVEWRDKGFGIKSLFLDGVRLPLHIVRQ